MSMTSRCRCRTNFKDTSCQQVGHNSHLCTVGAKYKEKLLSKQYSMEQEREKRVTVQWRNPTRTISNKVIWVNLNSDKYCWQYVPFVWQDENGTFPPKTCDPNIIMRKTSDKSQLRDILQNAWRVLLKTVSHWKQGKAEKLSQPRRHGRWHPRWAPQTGKGH